MLKRASFILLLCLGASVFLTSSAEAQRFRRTRNVTYPEVPANSLYAPGNQGPAFNQSWGQSYSTQDWNRLYHYPYVYYPQNFWPQEYYRSADDLYNRYPPEMRIPIYNKKMFNYHTEPKTSHSGFHYILDVF
ncbi:MAG: hypothetical protein Q4C96_05330 [Planctomycetia bacterium]|nr:hypothetical protein [Planctomycetia bacterium]